MEIIRPFTTNARLQPAPVTRLSGIGLRVTEEPSIPVASGYNVNWVGETAIEVQVGETFTFTPALQANRGIWTPAQSTQPLGAVRGGPCEPGGCEIP